MTFLVISGLHKTTIHQHGLRIKLIITHFKEVGLDNDNCYGRS
jgi:hypothetical protein